MLDFVKGSGSNLLLLKCRCLKSTQDSFKYILKCKYIVQKMNCWKKIPNVMKLLIVVIVLQVMMGRREGHLNKMSKPSKGKIDKLRGRLNTLEARIKGIDNDAGEAVRFAIAHSSIQHTNQ